MPNDFDGSARNYDAVFSHSEIGKAQRNRVHHYILQKVLKGSESKRLNILEINCGTGEDAKFFFDQGHRVLATDISEKMIDKARDKYPGTSIRFQVLDIRNLNEEPFDEPFDLIFSNFGGLNCIDHYDLKRFVEVSSTLLKTSGKMALVIMAKKCLWERFYFAVKGRFGSAFRRNTNESVMSHVDGTMVRTWYYSPKDVIKMSKPHFDPILIRPIGICIPPSYLEPFFRNRKRLLGWLIRLERIFSRRFYSDYADHFIIVLQKK